MKTRWLMMSLLMHTAIPAMAQLANDPENPTPALTDPPKTVPNAVQPSQINAGKAEVSPAGAPQPKNATQKSDCKDTNPCATPTPAAR
jgi:hypothetical protein